jgi:predicted DNA-binding transcriptional regulator YafY
MRTFRVDRVTAVTSTGEPVVRPEGFDVADAWRRIADEIDERRAPLRVDAIVARASVEYVRWIFGTRFRERETRPDGTVVAELRAHTAASIARELASIGSGVEVLAPGEVRVALAALAREIVELYTRD